MNSQDTHRGTNPGQGRNRSIKNAFFGLISLLKLIRHFVFQSMIHFIDAAYDLARYSSNSNSLLQSTHDRQKLESLLFLYYHKIEKSLALPEVKPVFGLGYIETLLDFMEQWVNLTGDYEAIVFRSAYGALSCYQDHVGSSLRQSNPDLAQRIEKILTDHKGIEGTSYPGGAIAINGEELQSDCQTFDFDRFVHYRHSVRNFTDRHIPDMAISQAVRLAQQSPSVCNRQSSRVHVFTSAADKEKVLKVQNGNAGFGHLADRVLLITADLRSFVSSGERNQAYTDSGMFAMTLVYALQAQGIASCCLNLSHSFSEDIAFRRVCKIPKAEVPVMLIVIGYPPDHLKVATSARVSTESILFFRNIS